ncbi:hypothetical protein Tco_0758014 [Tanacetum coccineum]
MIGSLMYLTASRPDLQFAVSMCARYLAKPTESTYMQLTFADADHAGCQDTRRSTSRSSTRYLCTAITKVPLLYVATTSNILDPSILTLDITSSKSKWKMRWLNCISSNRISAGRYLYQGIRTRMT